MDDRSRRKHRRFAFQYRIKVRFPGTGRDVQGDGVTKNISAGGVLFESSTPIPKRSPVSFTIVAQGEAVTQPIEVTGEGRVVRVELDSASAQYAIALKCVRPLQFHRFEPKDNSEMKSA